MLSMLAHISMSRLFTQRTHAGGVTYFNHRATFSFSWQRESVALLRDVDVGMREAHELDPFVLVTRCDVLKVGGQRQQIGFKLEIKGQKKQSLRLRRWHDKSPEPPHRILVRG